MAKTLSNLRDHVRTYLDEVSAADWTDVQVEREINYAYLEVVSAVIDTYEDYYRSRYTADFVASQDEYELPTDFLKMRRLELKYVSTDERIKANRFSFNQIPRATNSTSYSFLGSPIYDLSGDFIKILPVPTVAVTEGILMYYIRQVSELSEDTDEIDIPFPDRYGKLVTIGATAELLRKGQQEEAVAAKYDDKFQIGLEKMKSELEDRIADGPKMIEDTLGEYNDFGNSSFGY